MASRRGFSPCNFLLPLVLVVVFKLINVTSGKPTTPSSSSCSTLLGDETNQVFRGVDITDFDIMPLTTGGSKNLKDAIFEDTKTCVYSKDTKLTGEDGPLIIKPGTDSSSISFVTPRDNNSAVYWQETMIGDSHLAIPDYNELYTLSHSPSVQTVRQFLKSGDKVFVDAVKAEDEFKVPYTSSLRQRDDFVSSIKVLDATTYNANDDVDNNNTTNQDPINSNNQNAYNNFIASFGTHYIDEAYFGTVDRISVLMDKAYHDQEGLIKIQSVFWKAFDGDQGKLIFEPSAKAAVYRNMYGNNDTPFMYRTIVKPIFYLFKNHRTSENMERAVDAYIRRRHAGSSS